MSSSFFLASPHLDSGRDTKKLQQREDCKKERSFFLLKIMLVKLALATVKESENSSPIPYSKLYTDYKSNIITLALSSIWWVIFFLHIHVCKRCQNNCNWKRFFKICNNHWVQPPDFFRADQKLEHITKNIIKWKLWQVADTVSSPAILSSCYWLRNSHKAQRKGTLMCKSHEITWARFNLLKKINIEAHKDSRCLSSLSSALPALDLQHFRFVRKYSVIIFIFQLISCVDCIISV